METYFTFKLFMDIAVPAVIILAILVGFMYGFLKSHFRYKLMVKLGYEFNKGLGTNVAYEFQPRWVKGNTRIHYRKIDSLKYREIRQFVESQEGAE